MPDRVGQQFGNYRLIRLLGRGGFAEVYLGQHVRLASQKAALKILSARLNEEDIQAFTREAETITSLVHPHIVRILDFDIVEDTPFLVMDYAPNGSLRQRHRLGEQVPLPAVLSYIQQISEGLQYAHDHKIIHRDIKPDNMLIGARGEIVLSDFGIATIAHSTSSQSAQAAIGTIPYMAPEQMQEYPRPASDQYALAITVYEWLAGERPFSGTFTEVAVKHAMVPPPPLREKRPELSIEVEEVILTGLAKDPKARFRSVQAFASALEQACHILSPANIQASQSEFATQLALPTTRPATPLTPANATSTPSYGPNSQRIESQFAGEVISVAWSPDGKRIASAHENGIVQGWSAINGQNIFTYLGHSNSLDGNLNNVAWSPDGKRIASASHDQTVQVWNTTSKRPLLTYRKHTAHVWGVAWSPDGEWIVSASSDETVQVWNATNGKRAFKCSRHSGPLYSVAWSPDGGWIASASDDTTVQIWDAISGEYVFSYQGHSDVVTSIAWSPDGEWIASASDDKTVQVWNTTNGEHVFSYRGHSDCVEEVTWSPDGEWIASASDDKTVQVWNATNGKHVFSYQGHSDAVNSVAWSPDGKRIVSGAADGMIHIWQVF